ncbi:hypothetical protein AAC387_Pa07g3761 [Persea americana]
MVGVACCGGGERESSGEVGVGIIEAGISRQHRHVDVAEVGPAGNGGDCSPRFAAQGDETMETRRLRLPRCQRYVTSLSDMDPTTPNPLFLGLTYQNYPCLCWAYSPFAPSSPLPSSPPNL